MSKQKGSNKDKPVDDPLERRLAFLLRERDGFLTLLKKSEKWPLIAPELQAAADKIKEGAVVHIGKICLRLGEEGVPEADVFNLNGLLCIQMALFEAVAIAWASNGSINQLMSDLVLHLFMAGGASQRLHGEPFVLKEFERQEPIIKMGQKFIEGREKPRLDKLGKAMRKTLNEFISENKMPTARELWEAVPIDRYVQDKDIEDLVIYWRTPKGIEKKTSFKRFQTRFTNLKKNLNR